MLRGTTNFGVKAPRQKRQEKPSFALPSESLEVTHSNPLLLLSATLQAWTFSKVDFFAPVSVSVSVST